MIESQWYMWDNYLEECGAVKIPTSNVDVDTILNNYFKRILPFENQKPNEFKDAIIVESVRNYFRVIRENESIEEIYVVAADKGMRKSFRNDKKVIAFDNLNKFINYVILHTEHLALAISKRYNKELFDAIIRREIIHEIYMAEFDIEDYWEDFTVKEIQYIAHKMGYINVVDKNFVEATLEICAKICVDYLERDERKSYYNEEEGCYLLDAFIEYREWHRVQFEAILVIDIDNIDENAIKEKINISKELLEEFDESVLKICISPKTIKIPKGTVISMNGGTFIEKTIVKNILDGWEYKDSCV